MRAAIVVCLLLCSALAGCRGDRDKCAAAAHRFAELVYWERVNPEIAKLPTEAERDAERKRKLVEFEKELESQLQLRINQCVAAGATGQAECIIKSKTAAEALDCADLAKGPDESENKGIFGCAAGGQAPLGALPVVAVLGLFLARRRRRR